MSAFEDTPPETPAAVLSENRPYVMVLANAVAALHANVRTWQDILTEVRTMSHPVGSQQIDRMREAFGELEALGARGREAMRLPGDSNGG